jgi:hypothetical protein
VSIRVNKQEVHDMSERNAVPKIPDRAAEDKPEAGAKQSIIGMASEEMEDEHRRPDRDRDEESALPSGGIRKKAERSAGIEREYEIEERYHRHSLSRRERRQDSRLAHLIKHDDPSRQRKPWDELPHARAGFGRPRGHA